MPEQGSVGGNSSGDHLGAVPAAGTARSDDLTVLGRVLSAKFELLGRLGQGSMGLVLKVRHRQLGRLMALKLLNLRFVSDQQFERFLREARVACETVHPCIPQVFDLDRTEDGTPYIAMELLDGEDLGRRLQRQGKLSLDEVLRLFRGTTEALDRVHARGFVHRDLKPANLFRTDEDRLVLLDFGVCHDPGSGVPLTQQGQLLGTPLYMAPEQLDDRPVTPSTDLYALSVILFEALCGRRPFLAETLLDLLRLQRTQQPPLAHELCPELPPAVSAVLRRGLAHRPSLRWPSAGVLYSALVAAAQGIEPEPPPALRPSLPEAPAAPSPSLPRTPVARPRRRLALAAVPLLLLALGVAGALGIHRAPRPTSPEHGAPLVRPDPTWPQPLRLLVLPFAGNAERIADRSLIPLTDRLLVNALEVDERILGRLERVDPAALDEQLQRRELEPPLAPAVSSELALALGANVVLQGRIDRAAGDYRLTATLRRLPGTTEVRLEAGGAQLTDGVRALAQRLREVVWGSGPAEIDPRRASSLLVSRPESLVSLLSIDGLMPLGARQQGLEQLLATDPAAVGAAWGRALNEPSRPEIRRALAGQAAALPDPELRRFLEAMSAEGTPDCAALGLPQLGERYPLALGPLAAALCHYYAGNYLEAERTVLQAHQRLELRGLATPLLLRILYYSRSGTDQIPMLERVMRLNPEAVTAWSRQAIWLALDGRAEEARRSLQIARALLGADRSDAHRVGLHAAQAEVILLDWRAAEAWLELASANAPGRFDLSYIQGQAMPFLLRGHHGQGIQRLTDGLRSWRDGPNDSHTTLAASAIHLLLHVGRVTEAERLVEQFAELYPRARAPANHLMGQFLRLAVDRTRGRLTQAELMTRTASLGEQFQAAQVGEVATGERAAQECMILARHGTPRAAADVLRRVGLTNYFLGGCRLRAAELLAGAGDWQQALLQHEMALREILWAQSIYADLIPAALLGYARALEHNGRLDEAKRVYRLLVSELAGADTPVAEVARAARTLKRLDGALASSSGR